MLVIQNVLVSDELVEEHFACDLKACKGACCWEGDYGAPLEDAELSILEDIYPQVAPYLSAESQAVIEEEGLYTWTPDNQSYATPLMPNEACAYLSYDQLGRAWCGIERAYRDGKIDWPKPISCHLYPIRVKENPSVDFEALNYDRWSICSAACDKGKHEKLRLFEFARTALVRKYGEEWYEELALAADYKQEDQGA
ncbi:MAG: DUF3109 family protein [Bacteroidota bacterium]